MPSRTRILVLTGAGISAESGLGTFRDENGLWTQYDLNDVATPEGFARNPQLVTDFYNARRANCLAAEPNAAHESLAQLEATLPEGEVMIVTQNVDDLHQRSGSKNVVQMHGSLRRALCPSCGHTWPAPDVMTLDDACPSCGKTHNRPDIVWFGEMPYEMERIHTAISKCEIFVAIGTSGQVYPASGFAAEARQAGAHCFELNLEPSEVSRVFSDHHYGPATEVVPAWVEAFLKPYF